MQCNECKWFVGNVNDHYGICKRYPANQNKPKNDFCGEFFNKIVIKPTLVDWQKPTIIDAQGETSVQKITRGRKPKNVD